MTGGVAKGNKAVAARVFGENVRRICAAQGMDQASLAQRSGERIEVIDQVWAGELSPELPLIERLADAIGVSWGELVRGV